MGRPGLVQKKVRVKTKRGVAMRTMWVKSSPDKPGMKVRKGSVLGFVQKHKGKIAGAAALAAGAYLAHKHGHGIVGAVRGAKLGRALQQHAGNAKFGHDKRVGTDKHGNVNFTMGAKAMSMIRGGISGYHNNKRDSDTGTRAVQGAKFAGEIARHPIQAAKGVRDFLNSGRKAVAEHRARTRK
jgi:hypothetical protein